MWFALSLISSAFAASLAEANRVRKHDAVLLNAWRATFAAILLAFLFPWMAWPDDRSFYIVAAIDGLTAVVGMTLFFLLAARQSGRVTSMSIPFSVMVAYLGGWLALPAGRPDFMAHPVQSGVSALAVAAMFFFLQKIRRNDNSWDSFRLVLPMGVMFGVMFVVRKIILGHVEHLFPIALSYTFVTALACALASWALAALRLNRGDVLLPSGMALSGFVCGLFWTAMFLTMLMAMAVASTPALPAALMTLTPVWLLVYNRLRRIPDDASPRASLGMIAASAVLLLASAAG